MAEHLFSNRYRIEELIGQGSFGTVYRAEDTRLQRMVALKILHPALAVDPSTIRLFEREAGILAGLDHDHIVPVYDVGVDGDARYIVMKLVEGKSLSEILVEEGAQPPERVAKWLEQIASGLDYAHGRGVLHRDLKPGNLLLEDERGRIVISDFGLARAVENSGGSSSDRSLEVMTGTAAYMAPEVIQGQPQTASSDLYSLGCVLYELVQGRPPFVGDSPMSVMFQQVQSQPEPLQTKGETGNALAVQIVKLLAKDPSARPSDAGSVAAAVQGEAPPHMQSPEQDKPKRPLWAGALVLISLAALAFFGVRQLSVRFATSEDPTPTSSSAIAVQQENSAGALSGAGVDGRPEFVDSVVLVPTAEPEDATAADTGQAPPNDEDPATVDSVAGTTTLSGPTATPDLGPTATVRARSMETWVAATLTALPTDTAAPTPMPVQDLESTVAAQAALVSTRVAATLAARPTATPLPPPTDTPHLEATNEANAALVNTRVAATLAALPTETPTPRSTATHTPDLSGTSTADAALVETSVATTLQAQTAAAPLTTPDRTATAAFATAEALASRPTWTPTSTPTPTYTPSPTFTPNATATAAFALAQAVAVAEQQGLDPTGVRVNPVDGAVYVRVPAGEFTMGSEGDSDNEQPIHTVYLDEFWIMQTEVTNAMYAKCVEDGACSAPDNEQWNDVEYAGHPVTHVSWRDASDYGAWAGGRLPTEAEWEKACRGTEGYTYPWGETDPNANLLNFNRNVGETTPVGEYEPGASPYGALDMAGNVREWTADWYSEDYYASSPVENPMGPSSGSSRVVRGGSFFSFRFYVRCAFRGGGYPDGRLNYYGFRVVSSGF